MCFIEKEHETLSLNLGKFSHEEKQHSGHTEWNLLKSRFSVKLMRFFF